MTCTVNKIYCCILIIPILWTEELNNKEVFNWYIQDFQIKLTGSNKIVQCY